MRKTITFKQADFIDESMEEDEIEFYKKYAGKYSLRTMGFGPRNESQFKAIRINAMKPEASEMDTWKFRFYSLIYSLEELPTFGKISIGEEWDETAILMIEKFVKQAPNAIGEQLLSLADEVNGFSEKERKN